jgi:hypothetical protein
MKTELDRLTKLKCSFDSVASMRVKQLLSRLDEASPVNAMELIRFHELLLFLRAYPPNSEILKKTEELLSCFGVRVAWLRESDTDLSPFADTAVSGIAGTSFSAIWSYEIAKHLAARYPAQVDIDWDGYEGGSQLIAVLKSFVPLFEDGAYVVFPVPHLTWIRAAKKRNETDLQWILRQFDQLAIANRHRASLYDSLNLWLHWKLGNSRATRSRMRLKVKNIFYHQGPLIQRKDVSLAHELSDLSPLPVKKLSHAEGARFIELARDAMTVRYRELEGFTYGDPQSVRRASAGRGVEFVVWGLPPKRRLPLLAYHAILIFKNGVPIGYAESLALFERSEVGVNVFYTFRDGESAWIYARLLRFLQQHLGVTVFSVEPYQLGSHNEEAIEAGAFWFYRKLGFRPIQPGIVHLLRREEHKLVTVPGHRTSARILRRLAAGHLLYESPLARHPGAWDDFRIPNIGLAVSRRMAQSFGGSGSRLRSASVTSVAKTLGIKPTTLSESEQKVFGDFALVLRMMGGLSRWSKEEKQAIKRIVHAKATADEREYVRLLQRHQKLRDGVRRMGQATP